MKRRLRVLSKIFMRIYSIIVQTHISPQSKSMKYTKIKKIINNML